MTVYFSIYSFYDIQYELWAVLDDIYDMDVRSRYKLDFSNYQSGLLKLNGSVLVDMEEVVMVMTYNTSGQVGLFKVEAAVDQIPNSEDCCDELLVAQTVGAFSKVLKIPRIDVNSSYYILIEGEKGTKFNVHFYDSVPSSPSIQINSSVVYYTDGNLFM